VPTAPTLLTGLILPTEATLLTGLILPTVSKLLQISSPACSSASLQVVF